jgi:hypothetical protein
MDVKGYFRRLKEKAAELPEGDQVLVSEATADGGKAGVVTVAPKAVACRLLVEGKARLATPEEAEEFERQQREAREAWQKAQEAQRIHVQVMNGLEREAREKKTQRR